MLQTNAYDSLNGEIHGEIHGEINTYDVNGVFLYKCTKARQHKSKRGNVP